MPATVAKTNVEPSGGAFQTIVGAVRSTTNEREARAPPESSTVTVWRPSLSTVNTVPGVYGTSGAPSTLRASVTACVPSEAETLTASPK